MNEVNLRVKTLFKDFAKLINQDIESLSTGFLNDGRGFIKFKSSANGYNESDRKEAEMKLDSFFTMANKLKMSNIILDLRGIGGGAAEIAGCLFSYLSNRPFYYFDYVGA